ncbi:MAG TPA: hypothetical protein VLL54_09615 [Pyrinomonadaceae bacterium]|nr:hypothetical protein [Pyrinomonadaceae bacterium]
MKQKIAFFLISVFACAISLPQMRATETSNAPARCVAGHTAPASGFWTWPAKSQVNVYLRQPDFSEVDVAAVRIAAENWDATASENGSNVHFSVHGLTRETKTAAGEMTLVRGAIFNKQQRHLAVLEAHSIRQDQIIDYALVIVDVTVKNAAVLTNVIAHEIGHSLGLLDCVKCSSGSTAMGLMKGANESNGIEGPTACDKAVVGEAYRELLTRVGPAPKMLQPGQAVDEGEEPQEDDTPVVRDRP